MVFSWHSTPTDAPPLLLNQHLGYLLKESWISKAVLALWEAEHLETDQPGACAHVFAFPSATDRLGIGPTMVRALRFWLRATGVMVEQRGQGVRRWPMLTPWGRVLAQHDPYLTRPESIWMLHAHLARNLGGAPAFAWFFQQFVQIDRPFTKEECAARLHTWLITQAPTQRIRPLAVASEVDCLLRMYLQQAPGLDPEQAVLASPFRRLGLLSALSTPAGKPPRYVFQGGQPPALVVLAALLLEQERKPQLLRDLVSKPGSVGRTFGISAPRLVDLLASLRLLVPSWSPSIQRIDHLEWVTPPPQVSSEEVMASSYRIAED